MIQKYARGFFRSEGVLQRAAHHSRLGCAPRNWLLSPTSKHGVSLGRLSVTSPVLLASPPNTKFRISNFASQVLPAMPTCCPYMKTEPSALNNTPCDASPGHHRRGGSGLKLSPIRRFWDVYKSGSKEPPTGS